MTVLFILLILTIGAAIIIGMLALRSASRDLAKPANEIVEAFVEELRTRRVDQNQALAKLGALLPAYLSALAEKQGRPLEDLIQDTLALAQVNIAGVPEIAKRQASLAGLLEVWVCAKRPLDLDASFYTTVRYNIHNRFVHYYYFLKDRAFFDELRERLIRDTGDDTHVDKHLHCMVSPRTSFLGPDFGLMLTDDPSRWSGQTVTRYSSDGSIEETVEMRASAVREAYLDLRPIVESVYDRTCVRLADEPKREALPHEEIHRAFHKVQ